MFIDHELPIEQGQFVGAKHDDHIWELCILCESGDGICYLFKLFFSQMKEKGFCPVKCIKSLKL